MKALAMIEVYGYLTAVEALDSALKAANVNLFQVICTRGGLVTVLITGDVGAVRAAADAAAVAAQKVGSVLSVHVIPRPADEIGRMLSGSSEEGSFPSPPDPIPGNSNPSEPKPEPEEPKPELEEPKPELEESKPELEEPKLSEPESELFESEFMESETSEPMDWQTLSNEELHQLTVSDLRAIARSLEGCSMTRREIRFGKKEELIAEIQRFCGQEG